MPLLWMDPTPCLWLAALEDELAPMVVPKALKVTCVRNALRAMDVDSRMGVSSVPRGIHNSHSLCFCSCS